MKILIQDKQKEKIEKLIDTVIKATLNNMRQQSEDWGLGEMDELQEIDAVEEIKINHINFSKNMLEIYLDIYVNQPRQRFDMLLMEIQFAVQEWFPKVTIIENKIIKKYNFGPGVDY